MIKILGTVSIMLSSSVTAIMMVKELSERVKILKEIKANAIYIRQELEYRAPAVEECFKGRGKFFSRVFYYIANKNLLPKDAIYAVCDECLYLSEVDRKALKAYAENITAEDIFGQIANTELLISALDESISEAEENYKTKGKLYSSCSILSGMALVIMLI